MEKYIISFTNGFSETKEFKTLKAAKLAATKMLSFGCGSVLISKVLNANQWTTQALCRREFWESIGRFGWEKWEHLK